MTLADRLSRLPAFGFGVSGPLATPLMSDRACDALIHQALAGGGAIFDTGPSYGGGLGEIRLGRALARHTDAFVMTKAGLIASGFKKRARDFSPEGLRSSIEASLQRLGRPAIDLLWLHGPDRSEITPEVLSLLTELRDTGRVRHFGIAGRTESMLDALEEPIFEAAMLPLNMAAGGDAITLARHAKAAGRIVFAIEILSGINSGKGLTRGKMWRAAKRVTSRQPAPEAPLETSGDATAEQALNWVYDQGGADIALMTTTSPAHLAANIATLRDRKLRAL